eukprot:sb/3466214/
MAGSGKTRSKRKPTATGTKIRSKAKKRAPKATTVTKRWKAFSNAGEFMKKVKEANPNMMVQVKDLMVLFSQKMTNGEGDVLLRLEVPKDTKDVKYKTLYGNLHKMFFQFKRTPSKEIQKFMNSVSVANGYKIPPRTCLAIDPTNTSMVSESVSESPDSNVPLALPASSVSESMSESPDSNVPLPASSGSHTVASFAIPGKLHKFIPLKEAKPPQLGSLALAHLACVAESKMVERNCEVGQAIRQDVKLLANSVLTRKLLHVKSFDLNEETCALEVAQYMRRYGKQFADDKKSESEQKGKCDPDHQPEQGDADGEEEKNKENEEDENQSLPIFAIEKESDIENEEEVEKCD